MRLTMIASLSSLLLILLLHSAASAGSIPYPLQNDVVDDCCCTLSTLQSVNTEALHPILESLVRKTFFKYFRVNLYKECPFWVQNTMCGLGGGCSVCECDENEIPLPWKVEKSDAVKSIQSVDFLNRWNDNPDNMWIVNDGDENDMSYVNLAEHPEGNTGYDGDSARIWKAIYNENCFHDGLDSCVEKRAFVRLVSGLHGSITTHIALYFSKDQSGQWQSNPEFFYSKIGAFPDRVKNLYFSYLVLLRAVHKAGSVLSEYHYNTGNPTEDAQTKDLVVKLVQAEMMCEPTFDETLMFSPQNPDARTLMKEFKDHFRNISLIMDCVGCEKCKIWGKMEVLGLGTAFKILFDNDLRLQRNEIIALINTLRQFSDTIHGAKTMMEKLGKPFPFGGVDTTKDDPSKKVEAPKNDATANTAAAQTQQHLEITNVLEQQMPYLAGIVVLLLGIGMYCIKPTSSSSSPSKSPSTKRKPKKD